MPDFVLALITGNRNKVILKRFHNIRSTNILYKFQKSGISETLPLGIYHENGMENYNQTSINFVPPIQIEFHHIRHFVLSHCSVQFSL